MRDYRHYFHRKHPAFCTPAEKICIPLTDKIIRENWSITKKLRFLGILNDKAYRFKHDQWQYRFWKSLQNCLKLKLFSRSLINRDGGAETIVREIIPFYFSEMEQSFMMEVEHVFQGGKHTETRLKRSFWTGMAYHLNRLSNYHFQRDLYFHN